jgi:hypothetical protein
VMCNFVTKQHNLYMTHHAQGAQQTRNLVIFEGFIEI